MIDREDCCKASSLCGADISCCVCESNMIEDAAVLAPPQSTSNQKLDTGAHWIWPTIHLKHAHLLPSGRGVEMMDEVHHCNCPVLYDIHESTVTDHSRMTTHSITTYFSGGCTVLCPALSSPSHSVAGSHRSRNRRILARNVFMIFSGLHHGGWSLCFRGHCKRRVFPRTALLFVVVYCAAFLPSN